MFSKVLFIGLLFVALAVGQITRNDVLVIDPFTPDTDVIVIVITSTTTFPQQSDVFTQDSGILGGERDLKVVVTGGTQGQVVSSGVSDGTWTVTLPPQAQSIVTMQYDGTDSSTDLNTQGLAGVDLTTSNADAFRFNIESDIATTYTIKVYGQNGGQSQFDLSIPRATVSQAFFATYTSFTGNADFSSVGAIEIVIDGAANVDTAIDLFALSAESVPAASPSASPAPAPSQAPVGFTWYTVDDDFDREPCEDDVDAKSYWVTQKNIIYYYFYRAYYEPVVIYNSAANVAPYLLGTAAALVLALF